MRRLLAIFSLSAITTIASAIGREQPRSFPPLEMSGITGRMFNDIPIATGGEMPEPFFENPAVAESTKQEGWVKRTQKRGKAVQEKAKAAQEKIKDARGEVNKVENKIGKVRSGRWSVPFANGDVEIDGQNISSSMRSGDHWAARVTVPNFGTAPGVDIRYTPGQVSRVDFIRFGILNAQVGNFARGISAPSAGQVAHNLNITNTLGAELGLKQIKLNKPGTSKFTGGVFAGADADNNQFASVGAGTAFPLSRVISFNASSALTQIAADDKNSRYDNGSRVDVAGGVSATSKVFGLTGLSTLMGQITEGNTKVQTAKFRQEFNYNAENTKAGRSREMKMIFEAFANSAKRRGLELSVLAGANETVKKEGIKTFVGPKFFYDPDSKDFSTSINYNLSR